jgi:hypothetical protein
MKNRWSAFTLFAMMGVMLWCTTVFYPRHKQWGIQCNDRLGWPRDTIGISLRFSFTMIWPSSAGRIRMISDYGPGRRIFPALDSA